jgi:hypothetical protein
MASSRFVRWGIGAALGATLFTIGLLRYVSATDRAVFHRWSVPIFAVILVALAGTAFLWRRSWRLARLHAPAPSAWSACLDLALLAWGGAKLIIAVDSPPLASNILEGNLIGTDVPAAALLSWLALGIFVAALLLHPAVRSGLLRHGWALSLATMLVVAVLGEGVARCWAVASPISEGFPTYRRLMWVRRYVHLNHAGFRDVDHDPASPSRRLLLIGDSYAYGWGMNSTTDRLGERLVGALDSATREPWELYNVSLSALDTRQEIGILRGLPPLHPAVVIVLYVFNDLEYLSPITPRTTLADAPRGILGRLSPVRVLFNNSFLYQELYLRFRHVEFLLARNSPPHDPYADSALVARHLEDICSLVRLAGKDGAQVGIVPFDMSTAFSPASHTRVTTFIRQAVGAGIPVWPIDSALAGRPYASLVVNMLDGHANALANRLAAQALLLQILPLVTRASAPPTPTCRASTNPVDKP